jgi:hypothetical protein
MAISRDIETRVSSALAEVVTAVAYVAQPLPAVSPRINRTLHSVYSPGRPNATLRWGDGDQRHHPGWPPARPPWCPEREVAPLSIPRPSATPGPLGSPREGVIGERRVVEDHGLGLAAEQADLQLVPEPRRVLARPVLPQPVEPAAGLGAMAQPVVGQRQEGPVPRPARAAPGPDRFLQPARSPDSSRTRARSRGRPASSGMQRDASASSAAARPGRPSRACRRARASRTEAFRGRARAASA